MEFAVEAQKLARNQFRRKCRLMKIEQLSVQVEDKNILSQLTVDFTVKYM